MGIDKRVVDFRAESDFGGMRGIWAGEVHCEFEYGAGVRAWVIDERRGSEEVGTLVEEEDAFPLLVGMCRRGNDMDSRGTVTFVP